MRKCQSFIGQGVGNDIIFAVDVIHSPVNPARSERMTELDARSEMRPQIGRAFNIQFRKKSDGFFAEILRSERCKGMQIL